MYSYIPDMLSREWAVSRTYKQIDEFILLLSRVVGVDSLFLPYSLGTGRSKLSHNVMIPEIELLTSFMLIDELPSLFFHTRINS